MKKIKKTEADKVLLSMMPTIDNNFRQQILNSIDNFILDDLMIDKEEVPWLNSAKDNYRGYLGFLEKLRLTYIKVFYEYEKKHVRKIH